MTALTLDERHKIYASMNTRDLHVFAARVMFENPDAFEDAAEAVRRYRERKAAQRAKEAEQNGAST